MQKYAVPIKVLFDALQLSPDLVNQEQLVSSSFEVFVKTPSGEFTKILGMIEKTPTYIQKSCFSNEQVLRTATNHWYVNNGSNIKARDIIPGSTQIDFDENQYGYLNHAEVESDPKPVFDINIAYPHLYVNKGVVHHNTFFSLSVVKEFLASRPKGVVVLFESEGGLTKQMLVERDLDPKRILVIPIETVEQMNTQAVKILDKYLTKSLEFRTQNPMIMVLDSLGMLSTIKEVTDTASGSEKKDMTRAQLIKKAFRTMTLKMSVAKVPFIVTNHTYDETGPFGARVMSGGCLVPSTPVLMSNGTLKNIGDIEPEEFVSTEHGPRKVLTTYEFTLPTVTLGLSDNSLVICSERHRFLVPSETYPESTCYKKAGDFEVGDNILTFDGKYHGRRCVNTITENPPELVRDIEVADGHHYILGNGVISHNSGGKYAATITVFLSKAKAKDGDVHVGNILTATLKKGRLTREGTQVKLLLRYDTGLNRYYGLLPLALESGVFTQKGNKIVLNDGEISVFESKIHKDPEKYFTPDILDKINEFCGKKFKFGSTEELLIANSDDEDETEEDNE